MKRTLLIIGCGDIDDDNNSDNGSGARFGWVGCWAGLPVAVRLAQRVPVRIAIDPSQMPPGTMLAAGTTATIEVHPRGVR